jgi:hypothetical protein
MFIDFGVMDFEPVFLKNLTINVNRCLARLPFPSHSLKSIHDIGNLQYI